MKAIKRDGLRILLDPTRTKELVLVRLVELKGREEIQDGHGHNGWWIGPPLTKEMLHRGIVGIYEELP